MKWELKKAGWRAIEVVFTGAMYVWGWVFPDPVLLEGPDSVKKLPAVVKEKALIKSS